MKKILITGGAGFIGSHLVKYFVKKYKNYQIINIDALTYAGNLSNLKSIEHSENYEFIEGNITDRDLLVDLFKRFKFDSIIHLAAESHVDRSIQNPLVFAETNILGTINLLDACLELWGSDFSEKLFYHISTDEVYGSLGNKGKFTEITPYSPNSPYSASKASSDHFVRAYAETFNLPVKISNCSNNYGPYQFPEKLIPLFIQNIIQSKPLPVYGNGENIRDWLFVEDHVNAIDEIYHKGSTGETYNIGGCNEWKNIDLIRTLCEIMDSKLCRESGESAKLIKYVKDRPGHDLRYAIDARKIKNDLGWSPKVTFQEGLERTVLWYLKNSQWVKEIQSGEYLKK